MPSSQRKMCKSMLTLLILANFFISDYCKQFCIQPRIVNSTWQLAGFGCSFCLAIVQAFRMSVLYFPAHASSDDDNRSPFQLSLAHAIFPNMFPSLNDNETISILDKCPSLMDGSDAKRFLRWFLAVEYYHLLIAIFSLLCIFFCSAPLLGSILVHLGHNCTCRSGLTIFILDEDSQGKGIGPCRWFATQTLASEWKAWSMSLWELIRTSSD